MNKGGRCVLEMVQSELFWSLFVIKKKKIISFFFLFNFLLESGATPVYPEQLAGMHAE